LTFVNCPPAPLPAQAVFDLDAAVGIWRAAIQGSGRYWAHAMRRGADPFDLLDEVLRWSTATSDRRRPQWSTPHEIVAQTRVARVRDFSDGGSEVVPTLLVPPQAGHDSCIVDFSPQQSQVGAIREAGLTSVASLDWIGADAGNLDATIDDYLHAIDVGIDALGGGPVNLIGDCQGGWLAVVYAALRREQINTLTIAGAPIDFHAGEPDIHRWLRTLAPGGDLAGYRALVAAGGGAMPGAALLGGFIALRPADEVAKHLDLLVNLGDEAHLERYRRFEDWYKHTQDVPGAFYLWIVEHLFRDNELIRGELEVAGETVDLRAIRSPLNLIAGATDHITPPAQVFAIAGAAETPPDGIVQRLSSGGHLGLFMGHEALREHWPPVLAAVRERS
jgi:poly(3-hydroxyalkanoate) synthetase